VRPTPTGGSARKAQANPTLEIADAQKKLQDMQAQALELAAEQATATAAIARSQQAVVSSVQEELAVLRAKHDALLQQYLHALREAGYVWFAGTNRPATGEGILVLGGADTSPRVPDRFGRRGLFGLTRCD
jgi:hypothetical protein